MARRALGIPQPLINRGSREYDKNEYCPDGRTCNHRFARSGASIATLADVVRHYEKGGIARPSRSPLLAPIQLTDAERRDLVAFMESLTDDGEDPRPSR
jgi:hypothetical protein